MLEPVDEQPVVEEPVPVDAQHDSGEGALCPSAPPVEQPVTEAEGEVLRADLIVSVADVAEELDARVRALEWQRLKAQREEEEARKRREEAEEEAKKKLREQAAAISAAQVSAVADELNARLVALELERESAARAREREEAERAAAEQAALAKYNAIEAQRRREREEQRRRAEAEAERLEAAQVAINVRQSRAKFLVSDILAPDMLCR